MATRLPERSATPDRRYRVGIFAAYAVDVSRWVVAVGLVLVLAGVGSAATANLGADGAIAFDRIDAFDPNTGAYHAAIWITTGHGRARRLVGHPIISAIDLAWEPDGQAVAFARDCSFKYALSCSSLWRMNANGSGLQKVSDGKAQDHCPAWSPDGARIAFTAEFAGVDRTDTGIYLMNADGSSRTAVDKNELDGCPAWSPDGSQLTFWRANGLFVVRTDGSHEHQIASSVGHYDAEPDWSPDGTRIAFAKSTTTGPLVCVIRASGTSFRSLARGDSPAWSPRGRRIAFARGGEIYTVAAAGGPPVRVTRQRMHTADHPTWRPG
jgi:Tol biopolymer transport system component